MPWTRASGSAQGWRPENVPNPFRFPRAKHVRTRKPQAFKNYKQFKPDLRAEFSGQCVYCRMLDRLKGEEGFGVDHYRPKSLFPRLEAEYANLYYCCNRCNSWKREFWPNRRQQAKGIFIPNPCDDVMFEHMRYRLGTVSDVSDAGAWTVDSLDLNHAPLVELRTGVIRAVALAEAKIDEAEETVEDVERLVKRAKSKQERADLEAILVDAQRNLERQRENLRMLIGPPEPAAT